MFGNSLCPFPNVNSILRSDLRNFPKFSHLKLSAQNHNYVISSCFQLRPFDEINPKFLFIEYNLLHGSLKDVTHSFTNSIFANLVS